MKVGDIEDIVAQLRHDVCINGHQAYVLTCGCSFAEVLRQLAGVTVCGENVFFWIKCHQIPQESIDCYEVDITRKMAELRTRIFEVTDEEWSNHLDELYVVRGEGSARDAVIKVGAYQDVKSMLLQYVCIDGNKAYVVAEKNTFEHLLRDMAADCASSEYSLAAYEAGCIPRRALAGFCMNMSYELEEIRSRVTCVTEKELKMHGGKAYMFIRDMQLAVNTFAELVTECKGDLFDAVERFNDCYGAKSFFHTSLDYPIYNNTAALNNALMHPICFVGKCGESELPRLTFLEMALQYLSQQGDDALRASFFQMRYEGGVSEVHPWKGKSVLALS